MSRGLCDPKSLPPNPQLTQRTRWLTGTYWNLEYQALNFVNWRTAETFPSPTIKPLHLSNLRNIEILTFPTYYEQFNECQYSGDSTSLINYSEFFATLM